MNTSFLARQLLSLALVTTFLLWSYQGVCSDLALHGDRISLHVKNVALQSILQEFLQLGITVQIAPSINPRVTVSLDERELRQGLDAIIHPFSYALIWKSARKATGSTTTLAGLQVFSPGNRNAMRYLAASNKPPFIPGELLIKLTGTTSPAQLQRIIRQIDGTLVAGNAPLGVYKIQVAKSTDIPRLAARITQSGTAVAEPNFVIEAAPPILVNEAVEPDISNDKTNHNSMGSAPVAVLDSGLFPGYGLEEYVTTSYDPLHPDLPLSDSMGHGTQMAFIATGMVIPDGVTAAADHTMAPVIPIKIFDDEGLTSNYTLLQSIDFARQHNGRILSLSWETTTASTFLEQALNDARNHGAIIFAAAGNQPTGNPVFPAAYDSVIAVGALAADGSQWEDSNYGSFVDIYAPGIATFPVGNQGEAGTYAGTSISTAYIAGLAADYISTHPGAGEKEIRTFLGIAKAQEESQ